MRYLDEAAVRAAITAATAVERVRAALAADPVEAATVSAGRARAAAADAQGLTAVLAFAGSREADSAMLVVSRDGRPLATIEADWLTRLAAGAAAAVAASALAPGGAHRVGIVGCGPLADATEACLREAIEVSSVRRGGRDAAAATVRTATIIVTATRARDPVLRDDWLGDGFCLLALGATGPGQRELDYRTIQRATTVVTDSISEARVRADDLVETVATGHLDWLEVHGLRELARGEIEPLRRSDDVAVYKGVGAVEFVLALAAPLVT